MSSIPRTPLAVHAAWLATLIAALCLGGAAERGPAAAEPDASRPGPAAETAADEELVAPVATRSTRRVQRPAVQRVSDRSRRPSSAGNVMRATLREEEEDASVEADMPAAPPPPAPSPARSPRRIQELADDEEKELAGIPDPAELEMAADTPPLAPVDDESLPAASEEFVPEPPLPLPMETPSL